LVVLQKRAIRLVDEANYSEHSDPLFAKYKCLKLCDIVNLKTIIITFQPEYNMLPVNLQKIFLKNLCIFISIILDPLLKVSLKLNFVELKQDLWQ